MVARVTFQLLGLVALLGLAVSAGRALATRAATRPVDAAPMRTCHAIGLLEGERLVPWVPAQARLPVSVRRMVRVRRDAGSYMHLAMHLDDPERRLLVELELGPLDQEGHTIRLVEVNLAVGADGRLRARAYEKSSGARVPLANVGPGAPDQPTYVPVEDDPRSAEDLAALTPGSRLDELEL